MKDQRLTKNRELSYCNEITVLKLIISLIIVLFHYYYSIGANGWYPFCKGYLGVEFFFMVSGYLMMRKLEYSDLDAFSYTYNKAKKIYPHFFLALTMMLIYRLLKSIYSSGFNLKGIVAIIIRYIWEAAFLVEIRLPFCERILSQAWYISVMLIVGFFMFSLMRRFGKRNLICIFMVLSVISMILIFLTHGGFGLNHEFINIYHGYGLHLGLVRGFCDMSIGCLAYEVVDKLNNLDQRGAFIMKFIHLVMLLSVITVFVVWKGSCQYIDYVVVVCLFILVTLTFSRKSFFSNMYSNVKVKELEDISFAVYMYYQIIAAIMLKTLHIYNIWLYFVLTLFLSIFMIRIVRLISNKMCKNI